MLSAQKLTTALMQDNSHVVLLCELLAAEEGTHHIGCHEVPPVWCEAHDTSCAGPRQLGGSMSCSQGCLGGCQLARRRLLLLGLRLWGSAVTLGNFWLRYGL